MFESYVRGVNFGSWATTCFMVKGIPCNVDDGLGALGPVRGLEAGVYLDELGDLDDILGDGLYLGLELLAIDDFGVAYTVEGVAERVDDLEGVDDHLNGTVL